MDKKLLFGNFRQTKYNIWCGENTFPKYVVKIFLIKKINYFDKIFEITLGNQKKDYDYYLHSLLCIYKLN